MLMFSSAYARLEEFETKFLVALNHCDIPQMIYMAGQIVRLAEEVALLRFVIHVSARVVSLFFSFFFLGVFADCAWSVVAQVEVIRRCKLLSVDDHISYAALDCSALSLSRPNKSSLDVQKRHIIKKLLLQ